MTLFVPILLLFGFLTTVARKGDDFPWLLALVLVAMCVPTVVAAVQGKKRKLAPLGAILVFGFCAWALLGQAGVRVYTGPVLAGGSLVYTLVWATLAVGALSVAVRTASRYRRGRVFIALATAFCMCVAGLVVSPALFALGATSYAHGGMYYGIPLVQHLFWLVSGVVIGGVGAWQYFDEEDALPPRVLVGSMFVLAFATGVATGEKLWLPAILGILLVQYTFYLKNSL